MRCCEECPRNIATKTGPEREAGDVRLNFPRVFHEKNSPSVQGRIGGRSAAAAAESAAGFQAFPDPPQKAPGPDGAQTSRADDQVKKAH